MDGRMDGWPVVVVGEVVSTVHADVHTTKIGGFDIFSLSYSRWGVGTPPPGRQQYISSARALQRDRYMSAVLSGSRRELRSRFNTWLCRC
jgi:hypothetical protein